MRRRHGALVIQKNFSIAVKLDDDEDDDEDEEENAIVARKRGRKSSTRKADKEPSTKFMKKPKVHVEVNDYTAFPPFTTLFLAFYHLCFISRFLLLLRFILM